MIKNTTSIVLILLSLVIAAAAILIGVTYIPKGIFSAPISTQAAIVIGAVFSVLYFHYTRVFINWLKGSLELKQQVTDLQARVNTLKQISSLIKE